MGFEQFLQDPTVLTGLSLLGGQTRDIGKNILGAQQAVQAQAMNQQIMQQRQAALDAQALQRKFDPSMYYNAESGKYDVPGMLSGGFQTGQDLGDMSRLVSVLAPAKENAPIKVGPGDVLYDPVTREKLFEGNPKTSDEPAALREIQSITQLLPTLPEGQYKESLKYRLKQVTGEAAQGDRQTTIDNTQAQREVQNEARAEQRRQQNEQFNAKQVTKLSQMVKDQNIPQSEEVLRNVESRIGSLGYKVVKGADGIERYVGTKDIPGFGKWDSLIPDKLRGQQGQEMRQAVAPLANITLKDRSGAAVTTPEWERFKQELGSGAFMPKERLLQGIKMFRDLLESTKTNTTAGFSNEVLNDYVDQGGRSLGFKPRAGGGGGGAKTVTRTGRLPDGTRVRQFSDGSYEKY